MKLGPGIRFAIAAATLLAQLALPLVHGRGLATEQPGAAANGSAALVATTSDSSTNATHDPNLCPTCLALNQARAGVAQVLPALFFAFAGSAGELLLESGTVLPRAPELATAPPRAPPIRPLSFA